MGMKFGLLVGAGVGYVLGSKAGRHRYEQIKGAWTGFTQNPHVAGPVSNVSSKVSDAVRAQGEKVTDRVAEAVKDRLFNGGGRARSTEYVDVEVEFPEDPAGDEAASGGASFR